MVHMLGRNLLALALVLSTIGLTACSSQGNAQPRAGAREVAIAVRGGAFVPARVTASPGERLDLVFTRQEGPTCVTSVVLHSLDITRELPVGQPVRVAVTAPQSGTIGFTCPMDMVHGEVAVR